MSYNRLERRLFRAIEQCSKSVVAECLKQGIDVNAVNRYGTPALIFAIDHQRIKMAESLIEAGADVNLRDSWKATPLHYAANASDLHLCEMLLEKGANPNAVNQRHMTPLHIAAIDGVNSEVVRLLLKTGSDVNAQDAEGHSALYLICSMTDERITQTMQLKVGKLLMDAGANPFLKANEGQAPMDICKNPKLKKYMMENSAIGKILRNSERQTSELNIYEWEI